MRRAWVVLLGLAMLGPALTGCLGMNSDDASSNEELATQQTATVSESTGGIEGVVTDAAIQAIANATVTIQELDNATTTAQDGSFAFSQITPGAYTLTFEKDGFIPAERDVEVLANQIATVDVTIAHQPEIEPYFQQFKFEGFLECSVRAVVGLAACSVPNDATQLLGFGNATNDRFIFYHPIEPNPWHMVSELTWEANQPTMERMSLIVEPRGISNDNSVTFAEEEAPNPIIMNTDRQQFVHVVNNLTEACEEGSSSYCNRPYIAEGGGLQLRVFVEGINEVAGFNTVGLAIQQDFTIFQTLFYNAPVACQDYSIVEDNRCDQLEEPPENDPYEGSVSNTSNNSSG